MKSRSFVVLLLVALMILPVSQISAQGNSDTPQCQSFIRRAFSDLGTNCLQLDANTVCYGHADMTAMLLEGEAEPADFFAEPGYRNELTPLARITGSPFNLADEIWGLAKLHVQVYTDDIENDDLETLDDNLRDILYVMVGDVEIESAHLPVYDVTDKLVIDATTTGPMQEFYLRNGNTQPECSSAPNALLLIQGADDADTTIIVNGAVIKLNAGNTQRPLPTTLVLQILPDGETMRVIVLFGMATLNPDSTASVTIPPGYWTNLCLDEPQDRGNDHESNDQSVACAATTPAQVTREMLEALNGLQGLPGNILKHPISIPALIQGSGISVRARLFFNDPDALELAREACAANELPQGICALLFE